MTRRTNTNGSWLPMTGWRATGTPTGIGGTAPNALTPSTPPENGCRKPLMMAGVAAAAARVSVHVAQCRFTVLLRIASGTRDKSLVERRDWTFMILFTRPPEGRRSAPSHRGAKETSRIKAYLHSRALVSILSVRPTTYKRLSNARARLWTRPDPVGGTLPSA